MRMHTLWLAGAALLLGASTLAAAERKITAKDLPPAVLKAVQEETKGAIIKGYSKEVEHGKTMYEVETLVNGHARDLLFDSTGTLVTAEEAVTLDSVPAPVKAAFRAMGNVLRVETVTTGGRVTYEAQIEKHGKKSEVVVDAAGTPVKP
jgi:uncharacterized membrane protein YkoI